jgi:membrane protein
MAAILILHGRGGPVSLPYAGRLIGFSDMNNPGHAASYVLRHPGRFIWQTLRAFRANGGLLLAGAVAYYTLLSILPLLILIVIGLSHFIDQGALLFTLHRYLEWIVPGQAGPIVDELRAFLAHRDVLGWVLLLTILFFSSLAFTVLENAFSVIFFHRVAIRRRPLIVSAIIPYCYILCLGIGLLIVTLVSGGLRAMGEESIEFLGFTWSLGGISGALLYLIGIGGEILLITSIYMVMPVGRVSLRHALIGGVVAGLLWELTRHTLIWWFATLSQLTVVYGSFTTLIIILISLELGAIALLLGAQVISEYERIARGEPQKLEPLRTDRP